VMDAAATSAAVPSHTGPAALDAARSCPRTEGGTRPDGPAASGSGRRGSRDPRVVGAAVGEAAAPNGARGARGGGGKGVGKTYYMRVVSGFPVLPGPSQHMMESNSVSDRRIIEALAAPARVHRRLVRTARRAAEILSDCSGGDVFAASAELYGSLALDISMQQNSPAWKQDWASYYVNGRSDVDFVVDMQPRIQPSAVAERLLKKGPWKLVGQVQVHRFASTQFTLLGRFDEDSDDEAETRRTPENSADSGAGEEQPAQDNGSAGGSTARCASKTSEGCDVYLDVTCIEDPVHFRRFEKRQEAFRSVFAEARGRVEGHFGPQGALAFDAYIHLLKAFAAKFPGNALTGFQATCIGLFALQIGNFRLKPTHSLALSFFEGFLRFCLSFYGEWSCHYRRYAIDLSKGGRFLERMNTSWRSELYFMCAEESMRTRPDERMNVAHSLDPALVCFEAWALLDRAFVGDMSLPTPGRAAASAPAAAVSPGSGLVASAAADVGASVGAAAPGPTAFA